jgi:hypothetical protein
MQGECEHFNYDEALKQKLKTCIADARYVPTVLQLYNQSGTVDKNAGITYTDWSSEGRTADGSHPRTFQNDTGREFALSMMLDSYLG